MIVRGTTPILIFTVENDIDLSQIEACWITLRVNPKNANKKDITYTLDQMTVKPEDHEIDLRLPQTDTLQLTATSCQIQIRLKLTDGRAFASLVIEEPVEKVLNAGVI